MSIMNKLSMLSSGSVAKITRSSYSGNVENSSLRQAIAVTGKAVPAQQPVSSPDARKKELNNAVKNVYGYVQNITRELNFSVDQELGKTVVTVVDEVSGDVIRQIPSEDMLELSRHLADVREKTTKGLLFKGDA